MLADAVHDKEISVGLVSVTSRFVGGSGFEWVRALMTCDGMLLPTRVIVETR